jgi:hypothetical protein
MMTIYPETCIGIFEEIFARTLEQCYTSNGPAGTLDAIGVQQDTAVKCYCPDELFVHCESKEYSSWA